MDPQVTSSLEVLQNLLYLLRVKANQPELVSVYLDMAEEQLKSLMSELKSEDPKIGV